TRDVVESSIYLNDIKITLQDTAGIRSTTDDTIEQEGIKKSLESIDNADIILLVLDGTKDISEQEDQFKDLINKPNLIKVISKGDINNNHNGLLISAINNDIRLLIDSIITYIENNVFNINDNNNALLITQNQIDVFKELDTKLELASQEAKNGGTADVVALELEYALKLLGKVIGKEIDNSYIQQLFSNFCLGK
ncbi:MAG: GTPase, partial [Pikeienuella sp.]